MEQKKPEAGAICHVEIPSADPTAMKKFYGDCFGWQFTEVPEMQYTLFTTGEGGIGGGIMKRQEGMPVQHMNYIAVEDVDAATEKVKSNGGNMVVGRTEVPGAGWFTVCTDPEGNSFGLWQGSQQEC